MKKTPRIILTREQSRNQAWATRLDAAGLSHAEMPLVKYATLPLSSELDLAAFDWILLTSPQGAQAFTALRPDIGAAQCAVLGHGTAAAMAEAGWSVAYNAGALDGAEFVTGFLAVAQAPGPILLPGPKRRLDEPRASLITAGYTVRELPLYETQPVATADIAAVGLRADDVVFFCSPSAVRAFVGARNEKPRCVAIGRTTAAACRNAGLEPAEALKPDLESMVLAAGLGSLPGPNPEPVTPEMEP